MSTLRVPHSGDAGDVDVLGVARLGRDRPPRWEDVLTAFATAWLVLAVLLGTGLRSAEVRGLRVRDVRDGPIPVLDVRGKGDVRRQVPLSPDLVRLLRRHLTAEGLAGHPDWPLFSAEQSNGVQRNGDARREGRPPAMLGRTTVRSIVGAAAGRAALRVTVSPHVLRHTFATRQLRAGMSEQALQRVLGHRSIRTTMIYTDHLELGEIAAALAPLPFVT